MDNSSQRYVEAKREVKWIARGAKNEEWSDLGRELEADTQGGQEQVGKENRYSEE